MKCATISIQMYRLGAYASGRSIGKLITGYPTRFGKLVLTTNFDPTIEVSIQRSGGTYYRTNLHADGDLTQTQWSIVRFLTGAVRFPYPSLREELFAFLQTFRSLVGTQGLQTCSTRIEHGAGRQPQLYEIVPVLAGKDEVVLAAVEGAAEERAAIVDRASRSAKIDALTARQGGKQEDRFPRRPIRHHLMLVGIHCVAPFRMKEQTLIAVAARGAAVAGHGRLVVRRQTP